MKKRLLLLLLILSALSLHAQTGSWHAYISYYEPQQIIKGGNRLYVRASNGLYSYNLTDHSITTYDRMRQLSDTYIDRIAWNPTVKKLLIVYSNKNIDLLNEDDEVFNISSYYTHSMTYDKSVYNIYIYQQYAYLPTSFGILKLDMRKNEIAETYILKQKIWYVGISGNTIYAKTSNEVVYCASLKENLIDPGNWTVTDTWPSGIFDQSWTDWNQYLATVKTLQPGGPKYNRMGFMRFKNDVLYTSDAGLRQASQVDLDSPGTIQIFSANHEWSFLQDDIKGNFPGTESSSWQFVDMMSVDVDPLNPNHIFGGSRTGLYEFLDGKCVKYYYPDNSILQRATSSNRYVKVESVLFDANGNLWLTQSEQVNNTLLCITRDGQWLALNPTELTNNSKGLGSLQGLFLDSRGLLWLVNNMYDKPSFYCYNPQTGQIIQSYTSFENQDGITYGDETYYPRCITEDMDGNIWVGTSMGAFILEAANVYNKGSNLMQVKVPRNDGTDLADYLLANANINCIAIDGAGRKWVGTAGSGAYLISNDNLSEVHHFTFENSPLLSNVVESIAINPTTGEVYFGTDRGLCSYMGDATDSSIEMVKDNVYAFPNPVPSSYNGLITVRGLTFDADVKILTVDGRLVYQGRSNGGTFTWNGCDRSGRRVASGVYMIATATKEGKTGVVAKIAMVH
ncbi:MAG: Por secretion system protein [Prevotella sp.]|nr:Por secretion system protein [Prevotella sp.]